jgi:hypothetical protein
MIVLRLHPTAPTIATTDMGVLSVSSTFGTGIRTVGTSTHTTDMLGTAHAMYSPMVLYETAIQLL